MTLGSLCTRRAAQCSPLSCTGWTHRHAVLLQVGTLGSLGKGRCTVGMSPTGQYVAAGARHGRGRGRCTEKKLPSS